MGPTKAARYDGFPAIFFQHFKDIVCNDVYDFCLRTLNVSMPLDDCNFTNIVLIPKV